MEKIAFIIILTVYVTDYSIQYLTNPPSYGKKFDHYEAILFADKTALEKYIAKNECNGAILIDIEKGTQDTIKQKPITEKKVEEKVVGYEWLR